ncbi:unnamed protein product [Caenorhabditis angaria]|uniref:Uncharacterized protein n=1 Tax=Caenorhabditis angaria TaxID=860376 RepID=A0A9P1IX27_9PELO|nr:unnamed protein product [Caenorhabditis angaria]
MMSRFHVVRFLHTEKATTSFVPSAFLKTAQLSKYLEKNVLAHAPGRFIIIPKPYGVSCVGHLQENGGIFGNSVHDKEKREKRKIQLREDQKSKKHVDEGANLVDCIKDLRKSFKEPQLTFCTGLKRYLSGAIVLPCNEKELSNLKNSIRQTSSESEPPFIYNALAITIGRPDKQKGDISGFATFRNVGKHKEYIFEERKISKRAKTGKFAVEGTMSYEVLDTKNGCSLVEFSVNKWARHLPRLMLTRLVSPILGDTIYWRRLADIDGSPELVEAGKREHQIYIPPKLGQILKIQDSREILTSLPIYCHVYKTVFEDASNDQEIVAACKPPAHFIKMLHLLGLFRAFKKFEARKEEPDEIRAQELKF